MTETLEVRPCVNAAGNVVSYDLCPPLEEDATAGPVVASVYSGREFAEQLAAAWNTRSKQTEPLDTPKAQAKIGTAIAKAVADQGFELSPPQTLYVALQAIDAIASLKRSG